MNTPVLDTYCVLDKKIKNRITNNTLPYCVVHLCVSVEIVSFKVIDFSFKVRTRFAGCITGIGSTDNCLIHFSTARYNVVALTVLDFFSQ